MICDRLKELRKDKGLTQQEFADILGIKRNTVATYETGKSNPSDSAIVLICNTFSVSIEWLRYGTGDMYLPDCELDALVKTYNLSNAIKVFIEKLLTLQPKDQEVVTNFLISFASNMQTLKESGIDFYENPNTVSDSKYTYPETKNPEQLIKEKLASYEAELRAEFASKESQEASPTGSTGTESHKAI